MVEPKLAKELLEIAPSGIRQSVNDVWGIILGDKLSYYRLRNSMELSKKLQEEAEKLGGKIDPKRVPDQFAFEWGEAATRKSDETIQQMFARLLVRAATEEGSRDERLIFALRELSAEDAVLFKALYGDTAFRSLRGDRGLDVNRLGLIPNPLKINAELALANLTRLALIHEMTGLTKEGGGFGRNLQITTRKLIRPSALGMLLYEQIDEDDGGSIPGTRK